MSTNDDQPFKPGEEIEFCGDHFEVIQNFGERGSVKECGSTTVVSSFYWSFEGVDCKRVIAPQ